MTNYTLKTLIRKHNHSRILAALAGIGFTIQPQNINGHMMPLVVGKVQR